MQKIKIETPSKNHFCYIGTNILSELPGLLASHKLPSNRFVIVDGNVSALWKAKIDKVFKKLNGRTVFHKLPAGEKSKSLTVAAKIAEEMTRQKFNKDSVIIAIGGGVCGDIAGFLSSVYCRGVHIVHVPTSLLSMVDSSVGGKNGINFSGKKNNIGTIYQPDFILTDLSFLKTLPRDEFINGCGEMLKYAFLSDKKFFADVCKFTQAGFPANAKVLHPLIHEAIRIKASVVKQDETESDLRKVLNLGHTFAHGIESASNFTIPHGIAVSAGLFASFILSYKIGMITAEQIETFAVLPLSIPYPKQLAKLKPQTIVGFMAYDKKSKDANPQFVLVRDVGNLALNIAVPAETVMAALTNALQIIKQITN